MSRLVVRRLVSLFLLATAVAMGPGLALLEARAHAERRGGEGHGHRDHFEARGGQDHDDRCAVGIASAPAKPSPAVSSVARVPCSRSSAPALAGFLPTAADRPTLPPSRGPPALG